MNLYPYIAAAEGILDSPIEIDLRFSSAGMKDCTFYILDDRRAVKSCGIGDSIELAFADAYCKLHDSPDELGTIELAYTVTVARVVHILEDSAK
jgi:hypothetical protein